MDILFPNGTSHASGGEFLEIDAPMGWTGTRVAFDITPRDDAVNLRFSHTGLAADNEYYPLFNYRWAQYVRSRAQLLETGKGEPFQRSH